MAMIHHYTAPVPTREEIDALPGPVLVEFGTSWCGYCTAAQPLLAAAFSAYPEVRHIKIEDGPGRRLGRTFKVKLWPTLVFLRDGSELARVTRPAGEEEIRQAFARITLAS